MDISGTRTMLSAVEQDAMNRELSRLRREGEAMQQQADAKRKEREAAQSEAIRRAQREQIEAELRSRHERFWAGTPEEFAQWWGNGGRTEALAEYAKAQAAQVNASIAAQYQADF